MKRMLAAATILGALVLPTAGTALAADPHMSGSTGQPSQSCQATTPAAFPGNTGTSPGSAFNRDGERHLRQPEDPGRHLIGQFAGRGNSTTSPASSRPSTNVTPASGVSFRAVSAHHDGGPHPAAGGGSIQDTSRKCDGRRMSV